MKKSIITILLLLIVVLSACSTIQPYLPGNPGEADNESQNETVFEDSLNLTDSQNASDEDVEVIDLNEDETETDETQPDENTDETDSNEEEVQETYVASLEVIEGEVVSLANLQAQDPDGDTIEYTFSEPLSAEGEWQTQDGDEGTYVVTVTASDGLLSTSENIQIIVGPSNKGPVIDCPGSFAVNEGDSVELPCTIYDKEGDEVSYEVSGYATSLSFNVGYDDEGTQTVVVSATDGNKETTKTISLAITNVNRAPVVEYLEDIVALEGDTVELSVAATDADGDGLEVTYPLLFDADGRWSTEKGDAGTYELEVVVSDGESDITVPVNIIVEKVNSAPTLELAEFIVVDEGETVNLNIDASDIDGDELSIEITGFMTSETYETTFTDAGEYEVMVTLDDGKAQTSKTTLITINDVNRPPVFVFN